MCLVWRCTSYWKYAKEVAWATGLVEPLKTSDITGLSLTQDERHIFSKIYECSNTRVQGRPTCRSHRGLGTSSSRGRSSVRSADARGTPAAPDVVSHALGTSTPHTSGRSWRRTRTQQRLPARRLLPEKRWPQTTRPPRHWCPTPRRRPRGSSHTARRTDVGLAALTEDTAPALWISKLRRSLCAGAGSHRRCWKAWSFSESWCRTGGCRGTLGSGSDLDPLAAWGGPGRFCRSCGRTEAGGGRGTSPGTPGRWAHLGGRWTAPTGPRPCQYLHRERGWLERDGEDARCGRGRRKGACRCPDVELSSPVDLRLLNLQERKCSLFKNVTTIWRTD